MESASLLESAANALALLLGSKVGCTCFCSHHVVSVCVRVSDLRCGAQELLSPRVGRLGPLRHALRGLLATEWLAPSLRAPTHPREVLLSSRVGLLGPFRHALRGLHATERLAPFAVGTHPQESYSVPEWVCSTASACCARAPRDGVARPLAVGTHPRESYSVPEWVCSTVPACFARAAQCVSPSLVPVVSEAFVPFGVLFQHGFKGPVAGGGWRIYTIADLLLFRKRPEQAFAP